MTRVHTGVLCCLLGYSAFACSDAFYKALMQQAPFFHTVFWGSLTCLVLLEGGRPLLNLSLFPAHWRSRHPLRTSILRLHLGRAALSVTYFFGLILALHLMPLASVTAINFFAPLLTAVLARSVLKEPVGLVQWAALGLGLVGIGLVLMPDFSSFSPVWLLALFIPLSLAALNIFTKKLLGREESPWAFVYFPCLLATLVSGIFGYDVITIPTPDELPLILGAGVFELIGMMGIILGFARLRANTAGSFQYIVIVWATLIGALFFDEVPGPLAALGIVLVLLSRLNYLLRNPRSASIEKIPSPQS